MQPERIEKIKKLVQGSSLLNPAEKQEWISLTEIMNDKQLLELERILLPTEQVALKANSVPNKLASPPLGKQMGSLSSQPINTLANQQNTKVLNQQSVKPGSQQMAKLPNSTIEKPVSPAVSQFKPQFPNPLKTQAPNFSHIMNLPHSSSGVSPALGQLKPVPPKVSNTATLEKTSEKTKVSGFAQSLKQILQEKELPAPKKNTEKFLPQANTQDTLKSTLQTKPKFGIYASALSKTQSKETEKPKTPPVIPQPKNVQPAVALQNLAVLNSQPGIPASKKPQLDKPLEQKIQTVVENKIPIALSILEGQKKEEQKKSGMEQRFDLEEKRASEKLLKAYGQTEQVKARSDMVKPLVLQDLKNLSSLEKPAQSGVQLGSINFSAKNNVGSFKPSATKTLSDKLSLTKPADLSGLTKEVFAQYEVDQFQQQIKNLVVNNGYHSVIVSLEKSPLYKTYLNTGLKALNQEWNLNSDSDVSEENLLSKYNFEKFVDLLRKMQSF